MAIFPKWKNIQILSCFMCISISRPNQGRLTDNNSDSGLCSYVEPNRSLQWHRKTPQNAAKRRKTPQNAVKCCKTPQNDAKRSKCIRGRRQFTAKRRKNSNYIRDSESQDSNDQKSYHENGNENERRGLHGNMQGRGQWEWKSTVLF